MCVKIPNQRRLDGHMHGYGELACHQKAFKPIIPDSQGQVSSNKIKFMVSFITGWL